MHVASGVLLVFMVAVVLVDVAARFLFGITEGALDLTFPGGVELVGYSLLFMVLFALPYSVSRGQVIVDLFTERLGERAKGLLAGAYLLGFALLGIGMAIRFTQAVGRTLETGETSQDLQIPLYSVFAVAAFATAVLGLRGLLVALRQIRDGGGGRS